MMIDQETMSRICAKVRKGAKIYIGNNHSGRQRVKLVYGPFGVFTERFEVESDDLLLIKQTLKDRALHN